MGELYPQIPLIPTTQASREVKPLGSVQDLWGCPVVSCIRALAADPLSHLSALRDGPPYGSDLYGWQVPHVLDQI